MLFRSEAHTERLLRGPRSRTDELEWVRHAGPHVPGLLEHLKRQHKSYDAIVFVSLCHWTTVHGVEIAPDVADSRPPIHPVPELGVYVVAAKKLS